MLGARHRGVLTAERPRFPRRVAPVLDRAVPGDRRCVATLCEVIRRATEADLLAIFDLEKLASTTGLAHVFGPAVPFPDDDVLARWRLVLDEPGMTVLLDTEAGTPVGYAAFADGWLRHFGVAPAWWGTGRAQALHAAVLSGLAAQQVRAAYLWVLVENRRARAFYEGLGWADDGPREREVFEPYPVKMQMARTLDGPVAH
jgi:GNAT superfamily N-acetyltransferase